MKIMFLKALTQLELWFLQLVDSVMKLFNIFAGLETVSISGAGDDVDLLNFFLTNETVLTVFFILVALSAGVAAILTIVAVVKNMITMKRKMGKIVAQYFTAVFSTTIVGAVLILAIFLSSQILILVNGSFTGVAGTDNIGTQVLDITASNSYTDTTKAVDGDNKQYYYWIVTEDSVEFEGAAYKKGDIMTYNEKLEKKTVSNGTINKNYKDCFSLTNNWMVVLNGENFKQYSDVTHLTPDIMLGDYNRDGWPLDFETEPDSTAKEYWVFQGTRTDLTAEQYPTDTWKPFIYEDPIDGRNVWCIGIPTSGSEYAAEAGGVKYSDYRNTKIEAAVKPYDEVAVPVDDNDSNEHSWKIYNQLTKQYSTTNKSTQEYSPSIYRAFVSKNTDGKYHWYLGVLNGTTDVKVGIDGNSYGDCVDLEKDYSVIDASDSVWKIYGVITTISTATYPSSDYDAFLTQGSNGKYHWYLGKIGGSAPQLTAIDNRTYGNIVDLSRQAIVIAASPETDAGTQTLNLTGSGTVHYGLVNYNSYQYVIGLFAAVMLIIVFCVAIMGLIARLFDLVFLLLSSPLITATIPLDEGAKFKLWRETAISKTLLAYGTVLGVNIYCLLLPIINNISIPDEPLLTIIIKTLLIVVGALTISNSQLLFARILGTEAAEGRQAMHGMAQLVGGIATTGRLIKGAGNMVMGTRNPFTGRREFGMAQYGASALKTAGAAVGATAMGVGKLLGGNQFKKGVENTSSLIGRKTQQFSNYMSQQKNRFMNAGGALGLAGKGISAGVNKAKEATTGALAEIGENFSDIGS